MSSSCLRKRERARSANGKQNRTHVLAAKPTTVSRKRAIADLNDVPGASRSQTLPAEPCAVVLCRLFVAM